MSITLRSLRVDEAPGYTPPLGRLIWALEDTRARTLRALDGLPAAALDWSDAASPNSIGTLLYHIAAIEADWAFCDILGRPIPDALMAHFPLDVRDASGRLSPMGGSLESHLERLALVRRAVLDALRALSDADLDQLRTMDGYEVSPAWALHHLTQHEAEHRGQIGDLRDRAPA